MIDLTQKTPPEIIKGIAQRVACIRKRKKISQLALANESGVSLGSVKRFERLGEISLISLSKIAIALGLDDELKNLFTAVPYGSLDEIFYENRR